MPLAEARDFQCYSCVFENLGKRSIPSDHAAVRVVIQKPTVRVHQGKRIPSWMSKHLVIWSVLKRLDDHQYPVDPFFALADFKTILEKARRWTVRELSRKTPDSLGAKLLTASTALRAYRNMHLGTLMRCCKAWEPVGKCFDPISFECIDFHGLSQIIARLTRENLARREAELGHRLRKTLLWHGVGLDFEHGAPRNLCVVFTLLLMKTVIFWKTKRNQAEGYVIIGVRFSKHAPKVRGITNMKISFDMFRKLLTISAGLSTKMSLTNSWPQSKNLLLALMGFRTVFTYVREWLGSRILFCAYKHLLEDGTTPAHFVGSRTVFIPKSSDIDDNGRIVRSREALRPLTLCNCDCNILTTAICRGLHWYTMRCVQPSQRCISSRQMTDNILEIETTALAHVACTPRVVNSVDRFCCRISQREPFLDFSCARES